MQQWRKDEKRRLQAKIPPATAGTFAKDAKDYLKAKHADNTRTRHIGLWVTEFGTRPRSSIKSWEILAVVNRWLAEGPKRVWRRWTADKIDRYGGRWVDIPVPLSPSTVCKRMRALENLWTVLDGRHAPNPVREVPEPATAEGAARGLPYPVVEAILAQMPDRGRPTGQGKGTRPTVNLTKLRLAAIGYVGLSHSELMSIGPADLHLNESAPWVWVAGRKKGKGTHGTAQPLTEHGAAALRALAAAGGVGPFSPSSMWKSFQRACRKLELRGIRPYDLRHSFASEVLEKTGSLTALQLLMRHRDQRTSLAYGKRAIDPVRAAAIEQLKRAGGFAAPAIAPAPLTK